MYFDQFLVLVFATMALHVPVSFVVAFNTDFAVTTDNDSDTFDILEDQQPPGFLAALHAFIGRWIISWLVLLLGTAALAVLFVCVHHLTTPAFRSQLRQVKLWIQVRWISTFVRLAYGNNNKAAVDCIPDPELRAMVSEYIFGPAPNRPLCLVSGFRTIREYTPEERQQQYRNLHAYCETRRPGGRCFVERESQRVPSHHPSEFDSDWYRKRDQAYKDKLERMAEMDRYRNFLGELRREFTLSGDRQYRYLRRTGYDATSIGDALTQYEAIERKRMVAREKAYLDSRPAYMADAYKRVR